MNRAVRRAQYRDVLRKLEGKTPTASIANVSEALRSLAGNPRRPSDNHNGGAWLPASTFSAMAQALKTAQRQLGAKS